MGKKPILCIDFDGVIHDYKEGWKDGSIYGEVVPGFFEWADEAKDHFKLVVYSSRSKDRVSSQKMYSWLSKKYAAWLESVGRDNKQYLKEFRAMFEFASEKPAAYLTIDDRAICFDGDWHASCLSVESMKAFKPWNKE